jgi:hypothetical protein
VGNDPFRSASQAMFGIAQRALETVAQDVKSGPVLVCSDGFGHVGFRWL